MGVRRVVRCRALGRLTLDLRTARVGFFRRSGSTAAETELRDACLDDRSNHVDWPTLKLRVDLAQSCRRPRRREEVDAADDLGRRDRPLRAPGRRPRTVTTSSGSWQSSHPDSSPSSTWPAARVRREQSALPTLLHWPRGPAPRGQGTQRSTGRPDVIRGLQVRGASGHRHQTFHTGEPFS